MYCPKCGAQNPETTKFCRQCGDDLSIVAQAMSRHLPLVIADKLDVYLTRKNERIRRDSIFNFFVALVSTALALYTLSTGAPGTALFLFFLSGLCVLWGSWDYLVYKRSLSAHSTAATLNGGATQGLSPYSKPTTPQPSITDPTTPRSDD